MLDIDLLFWKALFC